MPHVKLPPKIASISGQVGEFIFYVRNGKQLVRRAHKTDEPLSNQYQAVVETLSRHCRE